MEEERGVRAYDCGRACVCDRLPKEKECQGIKRNTINEHQTRPWEAPVPITEATKHLFTFTNHVVYAPITPGTARTTAPPPVVGTRRFKNHLEFQSFLELGQHPTKASPCVCVQAVDWKHPMVYEEWTKHHETKAGEDIGRIL